MWNNFNRVLNILYVVCALWACFVAYWFLESLSAVIVCGAIAAILLLLFIHRASSGALLKLPPQISFKRQASPVYALNSNAFDVFVLVSGASINNLQELGECLKNAFTSDFVSCKQLKGERISITIKCPKVCDESRFNTLFSEVMAQHSDIAFGACLYRDPCQQLNVYQLAELALAIAKTKQYDPCHTLKLNQTNLALLQYSLPDMLSDLLNKQFLLVFEPVFSVHGEALLFHQVGITIRHQKIGLCDAKQCLLGCIEPDKLIALDSHLMHQLIKTLAQDPGSEPVSLCLDLSTWQSANAINELVKLVDQAGHTQVIRFSLPESVFVNEFEKISAQLKFVKKHNIAILLEHCHGALLAVQKGVNYLTGISLDSDCFQLPHEQQESLLTAVAHFANQYQLQLYANGVANKYQLNLLAEHHFSGASGRYFQQGESNIALGLN